MMSGTPRPASKNILRRKYSLWRLIRANLYDFGLLLGESWIVLAGFVLVNLIGTLYIRFGYDPCRYDSIPGTNNCPLGIGESLYETLKLQTLQSSLAFPSNSLVGQALFFIIPLLGLALIFQGVLNFGRLLLDKGSRREAWQVALASTYRDHIIVCGLGRVGMRTVQQLIDAGYSAVVIERDWSSEFVEHALNSKVPVVIGDAREVLTLRRAGVLRACAVVAAVNDDLLNIEIALTIRAFRPTLRLVLRVFNEDLDYNLEKTFGRNAAFSASALAAPTYAAAAVSRDVDYVLPTASKLLAISRLTISANGEVGRLLHDQAESGFRILQIESARATELLPTQSTTLHPGNQVTLIGSLPAIERAQLANQDGAAALDQQPRSEQRNTVIICGLGKVGYRVVRQMHALQPRPRIVVIRLPDGRADFPQRIAELEGVETVIGDARELSVLHAAGLDSAFSVAALTSDDLLNLQISLAARRVRPEIQIVVRVFSDVLAERLADIFGIRAAYSTSSLASPTLTAAALIGGVEHGFALGNRLFVTEQFDVTMNNHLVGLSVDQVRATFGLLVVELRRAGILQLLPSAAEVLIAEDRVILLGSIEAVARMR